MVSRTKIAIIGTGIAGNVVANRLHRDFDITVFESASYVGGHSNTIVVPSERGDVPLDTGFMVFNNRTYPNFIQLLDELGIESRQSPMTFSVQSECRNLEYNGSSINALFAQRSNLLRPSFYRMLSDILRFNAESRQLLAKDDYQLSLAQYLSDNNYSREFRNHYLIPMGAAIWSAEPGMMEQMPATFLVRFFENHGLLSLKNRPTWRVINGGSQAYVEKLVEGHRDRIRLNSEVISVVRQANKVQIRCRDAAAETFDYVFFACHSDQALNMIADPLPVERDILSAIPYQQNDVVLHTDSSLMPRRRKVWAAWNYHITSAADSRVSLTYHLNQLQCLNTREQYFVTLNSNRRIDPGSIIQEISYEHPVFHKQSVAAQQRHCEINGLRRSYFCGAYWRNGFHEDGVWSALQAIEHFNRRDRDEERHFQRAS